MKRRDFISLIGARWPLAARAQQRPIPRIGVIAQSPIWDHFRRGLNELAYLDDRDIVIEYRSAGQPDGSLQSQANLLAFRSMS
jgi:putative ABC transport system substrate-binding protein